MESLAPLGQGGRSPPLVSDPTTIPPLASTSHPPFLCPGGGDLAVRVQLTVGQPLERHTAGDTLSCLDGSRPVVQAARGPSPPGPQHSVTAGVRLTTQG